MTFELLLALNITALSYRSNFQFAEKFQEVKEAAKLARDKSQEKAETLSNHSQVNQISLPSEIVIQYPFVVQSFPVVALLL